MIIDIHTHIFPDKIASETIALMEKEILYAQGIDYKAATEGTFAALKTGFADCRYILILQ